VITNNLESIKDYADGLFVDKIILLSINIVDLKSFKDCFDL